MNRTEWLLNQVKDRYDWLQENYSYEVVGLFLRDSQNYGVDVYTDEYTSDVDVYAFVLPTLRDLAMGRQVKSNEVHYVDDSHIDVVDIRHGIELFRKANPSFLELLFTDYKYVNPKYRELWSKIETLRDEVATASPNAFLSASFGSLMQKRDALTHPYPSQVEELERHGFVSKQLHHLVRYCEIMVTYCKLYVNTDYVDFKQVLTPYDPEYLLNLKTDAYKLTLEQALKLADDMVDIAKETKNFYSGYFKEKGTNKEVFDLMYEVVIEMLRLQLS